MERPDVPRFETKGVVSHTRPLRREGGYPLPAGPNLQSPQKIEAVRERGLHRDRLSRRTLTRMIGPQCLSSLSEDSIGPQGCQCRKAPRRRCCRQISRSAQRVVFITLSSYETVINYSDSNGRTILLRRIARSSRGAPVKRHQRDGGGNAPRARASLEFRMPSDREPAALRSKRPPHPVRNRSSGL